MKWKFKNYLTVEKFIFDQRSAKVSQTTSWSIKKIIATIWLSLSHGFKYYQCNQYNLLISSHFYPMRNRKVTKKKFVFQYIFVSVIKISILIKTNQFLCLILSPRLKLFHFWCCRRNEKNKIKKIMRKKWLKKWIKKFCCKKYV